MKKIYRVEFKHIKHWGESNVIYTVTSSNVIQAIKTAEKLVKQDKYEDKLICIRCEYDSDLDN